MKTHIETLADGTPKSRRRCRKLLGWTSAPENAWAIGGREYGCQDIARRRELSGAAADAAKRGGGK